MWRKGGIFHYMMEHIGIGSNSHRIEKTITVWLSGPVVLCQNLHRRVAVWWNIRGGGDTRGAANIARIMQRTRSGKCVRLKMCVIIVEEQYPPPLDPDGWCHPHCATTSPLPAAGISLISTAMSCIYKKYFFQDRWEGRKKSRKKSGQELSR